MPTNNAYYSNTIANFLVADANSIIGEINQNHAQDIVHEQSNAWKSQIDIMQSALGAAPQVDRQGFIFLEFVIPRMGRRADVVIASNGLVWVLEFKVGADGYYSQDLRQTEGYALDLKHFHLGSHHLPIVPILVATDATTCSNELVLGRDNVYLPLKTNDENLGKVLSQVVALHIGASFDVVAWAESGYKPTPTIVQAAQALYANHTVMDIARSDAGAVNLTQTSKAINDIIHHSRINHRKSICFVTGVPGAGKTLVGLNVATKHSQQDDAEHAVFLSGNGPLVEVLREALARDQANREGISKAEAKRKTEQFIQNIHHFRDDALNQTGAPIEKVVIFDEAQRAWDQDQASKFMRQKRQKADFNMSEPEFLIGVMDRHEDWCTVIALIGGGQEINSGEAGIGEWLNTVSQRYTDWDVYYSPQLDSPTYVTNNLDFSQCREPSKVDESLHLSTSMRSFRAEHLSDAIHYLIDGDAGQCRSNLTALIGKFPVRITRNLHTAKAWAKSQVRGDETCGLLASSGGLRLWPEGVFVKNRLQAPEWFLNDPTDVRSCHYLEHTGTEFDVQGLELDWTVVAWDADYRYQQAGFSHWQFKGTKWQQVRDDARRRYLANAYRVLLTRARQGMVIFVPHGDPDDPTRVPEFYDPLYHYLLECGVEPL